MYKYIALVVLGVLAYSIAQQTTVNPRRQCEECNRFVGYAEQFYHRNPNATQEQINAELIHECDRLQNSADQQSCIKFVDSHIKIIYTDIKAGKRPFQVCEDLGLCPTRPPPTVSAGSG